MAERWGLGARSGNRLHPTKWPVHHRFVRGEALTGTAASRSYPAMADLPEVVLDPATSNDAGLIANLLELYIHDVSEAFPHVELGPDGRCEPWVCLWGNSSPKPVDLSLPPC